MPRYRITITSRDRQAMLDLVGKHRVRVFDHGNTFDESTGYTVGAIAEGGEIDRLRAIGYDVQQHEDVDELGRERQREVGRGNRYEDPEPS